MSTVIGKNKQPSMRGEGSSSSLDSYYLLSINSCLLSPCSNPSLAGSSFAKLWSPALLVQDWGRRWVGGQNGRILFPRSDMGRNEIRSQVVVSPASVMTEKVVKMAGSSIHFKDETSRILLRSLLRGVGNREPVNDFTIFVLKCLQGCSCHPPAKGNLREGLGSKI